MNLHAATPRGGRALAGRMTDSRLLTTMQGGVGFKQVEEPK